MAGSLETPLIERLRAAAAHLPDVDLVVLYGSRAAVGLRNRIAHGYATFDHEPLHQEATTGIGTVRGFLVRVADAAGL
jgi:uncharacterized protein with HEPN domain